METLKEKLLNIENEFTEYKAKIEKFHKLFIAIYFTPLVIASLVYIYSQFNNIHPFFSSLTVRIILFSLFALGIIIHFSLRYFYHKSNRAYKKFINTRLNDIQLNNYVDEEKFKNDVIETAKLIFNENGLEISNVSIKNNIFWYLVFIFIGVESDDY